MSRQGRPAGDERPERANVAFLIPFFGVLLLTPPLANIFVGSGLVSGVPLEVVYLFAVWVLVIAAAAVLSHLRPFGAAHIVKPADEASDEADPSRGD